ncbi:hypothetical protein FB567DRAFT_554273 [Paraphoma chrysanthemicola]|uniref:Uncharacterized protein n=1 Tax=Paraphoma chrysanthemicola TaxID=798071 RepID=A0A8K0QVP6_9PLEO|nr:hypothetical protein FB567DRAFT_554273 [Paraphoma chrysanthemicola]
MASYSSIPGPDLHADFSSPTVALKEAPVDSALDEDDYPAELERTHTLWRRLGVWSIWVLAGGTVTLVIVVAFLAMLWQYGNNPDERSRIAHAIAIHTFTAQSTTLSVMIIRLVVAIQSGVCTSLAAALLLEKYGVLLPDVLHLAAIKSLNGGPSTLLLQFGHQLRFYLRSLPAITITLLFLTATASQLASTILLSDFDDTTTRNKRVDLPVSYGVEPKATWKAFARMINIDYWGSRPAVYIPFGEIQEAPRVATNAHDSGVTYQGMVPFTDKILANFDSKATVKNVREYTGLTAVFGSRVTCIAPDLEASVVTPDGWFEYISGQASFSENGDQLVSCFGRPEKCDIIFNCTMPTVTFLDEGENFTWTPQKSDDWVMSLCSVERYSYWAFDKALFEPPMQPEYDEDPRSTSITLVLNRTNDFGAASGSSTEEPVRITSARNKAAEWSTYDMRNNQTLVASLCFSRLEAMPKYVKMESTVDLSQVTITWDHIRSRFNTKSVQSLLGTDRADDPHASKSVLDMTFPEYKHEIPPVNVTDIRIAVNQALYPENPSDDNTMQWSVATCDFCAQNSGRTISIHPFLSALFQDIVQFTHHPAIGLQAIYNTIAQSAYYEELPAFTVSTQSHLVLSKSVEVPRQWTGFIIVVSILGAHIALVAVIVWLFATGTSTSLIGEMWHSVGQVMNEVPEHLVQDSLGKTDKQLRAACRASGLNESVVGRSGSRTLSARPQRRGSDK